MIFGLKPTQLDADADRRGNDRWRLRLEADLAVIVEIFDLWLVLQDVVRLGLRFDHRWRHHLLALLRILGDIY